MTTTTVKIPDDLAPKIQTIEEIFGFTKEEFVQEAIRDKVLELQKKIFFEGTTKIAESLRKKKITEGSILQNFEKIRHS